MSPPGVAAALILALTAISSAGCTWLVARAREQKRLRERKAYEAEMERSIALGRERARAEREEAVQRSSRMQQEHAARAATIRALEGEIAERDAALARMEADLSLCRLAAEDATRLAERLQLRMQEGAPAPEWLSSDGEEDPDDLQSIRGLGPVLEQRLHELGIHRFGQLARMREADVQWLAARLRILPGRIRREQWAAQAREIESRKPEKHG